MYDLSSWKHVFKLDPAKEISDQDLEKICESGTDAVIVGGTDNITLDNVLDLMSRVRRYTVPCSLEVSNLRALTPGFDFYHVPMVFNSSDKKWITGIQHQAIKDYGNVMDWDEIFVEGYCIMNEQAKAYKLADCFMPDEEDVIAFARMAENMFRLPIFYLEYSGIYGDLGLVQKVKKQLTDTKLFYGGGISSPEQAKEISQIADVVVVGNVIYENIKQALKTVEAVKGKK
ncbi:heptaprenylglyceryl phosphate synthase [Radiobacillus sp. PE A8.2]|uniref:heptaprenylglyceryl phosphate synthase n=1 Tax=Radiobacillus sp. PE A8.2 TaxID=3380349 RepID=UPI00388FF992